ncbi:MAG: type II secretion system protein [Ruminococcus sp.]|nr:type II secretion system protein [Ruminococcus sp.]
MKKLTKKNIRHYSRRYLKSKSGSTLIELIAVVIILAITSSSCLSAMFSMVDVSKRGQQVSEAQRICALLGQQFSLYGNTACELESYVALPALKGYDPSTDSGFMDAQNPSGNFGDYCDYFIRPSQTQNSTIEFSRFDTTMPGGYGLNKITTIEGVDEIIFDVVPLNYFDDYTNPTHTKRKYVLKYKIITVYNYEITGGVVLNNTKDGESISPFSHVSVKTDDNVDDATPGSKVLIRIRSTNRQNVDKD